MTNKEYFIDLISKLKIEHNEICTKIDKLENFFQSDKFKELKTYHRILLINQHVYMCGYCNMLAQRILDLQGVQ